MQDLSLTSIRWAIDQHHRHFKTPKPQWQEPNDYLTESRLIHVNSTDEAKILEAYAQTIGISGAPRALAENVIHGKIMRQVNVQAQVVADTLGLNSTPLMTIADTGDGCVVSVLHRVEASGGDTLWEMDPHEAARFAVELAQSLVHDGSNGILQSLCANTAESAFGISPPEVSLQRRVYVGTHPLSLTDPHGNLGIPGSFHAGLTEPMRAADAAKREMTDKGVVIDQATASLIPDTSLLGPMEQIHPRNYPPVHARALHDNGIHCSKSEVVYDCHDMTTFGLVSVPPLDETTSMTVPPFFVSEGGDPNQADVISVDDDPYTTLAGNLLSQPREFTKVFHVSPFRYLDDEPDIMDYLLLERTRNGKNDEKPPISSKLRRIG